MSTTQGSDTMCCSTFMVVVAKSTGKLAVEHLCLATAPIVMPGSCAGRSSCSHEHPGLQCLTSCHVCARCPTAN